MRFCLIAMILIWPLAIRSQNFSGRWSGYGTDSSEGRLQRISLNISSKDSLLSGVMHWYDPVRQEFIQEAISGQYHRVNEKILLFDNSNGRQDMLVPDPSQNGYYRLQFKEERGKETLEGYWYGFGGTEKNSKKRISLERKTGKFIPLPIPAHTRAPDSTQRDNPVFLANNRSTPVRAIIPVQGDSVKIRLFDNGEIDGDSVALYFNNQLIIQHLGLKAQARVLTLPIDKELPVNRLVLVAENLGAMPPNTALMEVTNQDKIYNVFLSTDYQQNALVEFILKTGK